MSGMSPAVAPPDVRIPAPARRDDTRGRNGMRCLIATEAALFVVLFFSYFYLSKPVRWKVERPPEIAWALIMLGVLLLSSGVLHAGEKQARGDNDARTRLFLAGTILLGVVFLALQFVETRNHLKILTPQSDAYGSVFYTITGFHAAHLTMGLLMLLYVLVLPRPAHAARPPYRPYHVAAMYWHFVDFVWIAIVAILYLAPRLQV